MKKMYYIGLDVHKRTISSCVKDGSGTIHAAGTIPATRFDLDLRSPAAPGCGAEGGPSADACGPLRRQKRKMIALMQQDLRLSAVRFSAGVLHGLDGHSRAAAHTDGGGEDGAALQPGLGDAL